MKDIDEIYKRIAKDLTSGLTDEEKALLSEELMHSPDIKKKHNIIKEFWSKFFPPKQKHSIIDRTEKKLGFTYGPRSKTNLKLILKIAAIVLFILSFGFSAYNLLKPKDHIVLNEYSTPAGEIKKIVLSDGTVVWLNSKSFLIASEPFVGKFREVKLFGEAYFEVAHNEEQPFIVRTPQLKTKVLGTNFNIVAYPTDEIHEIALHEGGIKLNAENGKNSEVVLKPGERAYFFSRTGKINVEHTDLGEAAKWRDGILRFYDEDLFSITKKLERKFHTRILVSDSTIGNFRYSAEFEEESLETILELLKKANKFEYIITENGVIIQ